MMMVGLSVARELSRETAYGAAQRHIRVKVQWGRVSVGIPGRHPGSHRSGIPDEGSLAD